MADAAIEQTQTSGGGGATKRRRGEKLFRPLRCYGIEVDKVEDVVITVMCDGIYHT